MRGLGGGFLSKKPMPFPNDSIRASFDKRMPKGFGMLDSRGIDSREIDQRPLLHGWMSAGGLGDSGFVDGSPAP